MPFSNSAESIWLLRVARPQITRHRYKKPRFNMAYGEKELNTGMLPIGQTIFILAPDWSNSGQYRTYRGPFLKILLGKFFESIEILVFSHNTANLPD